MTEYKLYHEEIKTNATVDIPDYAICIKVSNITRDLDNRMYYHLSYLKPINKKTHSTFLKYALGEIQ